MKADETTLRETGIVRRLAEAAGLDVWEQGGLLRIGRRDRPMAIGMDRFVSVSAFRPVTGVEGAEWGGYDGAGTFAPGVKEMAGARMTVAGREFSVPEWIWECSSLDEIELRLASEGIL